MKFFVHSFSASDAKNPYRLYFLIMLAELLQAQQRYIDHYFENLDLSEVEKSCARMPAHQRAHRLYRHRQERHHRRKNCHDNDLHGNESALSSSNKFFAW